MNFRVLIVEDDPIVRGALRRELVGRGMQVLAVADVGAALRVLTHPSVAGPLNALVTDWNLPDGHGGEVLELAADVGLKVVHSSDPGRVTSNVVVINKGGDSIAAVGRLLAEAAV